MAVDVTKQAVNVKITWSVTNPDGSLHHEHVFQYPGVDYNTMVAMQKIGIATLDTMTNNLPHK